MAGMRSLEHRRYKQSLIIVHKSLNYNGPIYISDFLKKHKTVYNLRSQDTKLIQPAYNNLYYHNSFTYMVTHAWNKLPMHITNSSSLHYFETFIHNINVGEMSVLALDAQLDFYNFYY